MGERGVCLAAEGQPWECGKHSTYNNHACRGDACREANVSFNKLQRQQRHDRMVAGLVHPKHGEESTYFNYMCRCDECRIAHNSAETRRRNKRKGVETAVDVQVHPRIAAVPDDSRIRVDAIAGMGVAVSIVDDDDPRVDGVEFG